MKRILIIGAGFAGVWSALGAARLTKVLNKVNDIEIIVINKNNYHGIRPRYYEKDLTHVRVPLEQIFLPLGIKYLIGEVTQIDTDNNKIQLNNSHSEQNAMVYDRMILATGSHLFAPAIPGMAYSFNVDSYEAAIKLGLHIDSLPNKNFRGQYTIVVVGGGFTGLEVATEMVDRVKSLSKNARIIIVDHNEIASTLGSEPQKEIMSVLKKLNIEIKANVHVQEITEDHIKLDSGENIDTQTVIWTAGMRANSLTQHFSNELDRFGRVPVDQFLRIKGLKNCFAAGDVAAALIDETHYAVLSCQHAMPQGRIAGYNAVADLLGEPLISYEQRKYVTCLDLGSAGALYTEGWDRHIIKTGEEAKKLKHWINHHCIYPPEKIEDLLEAAAPVFKELPK